MPVTFRNDLLTQHDLRYLAHLLSPEYIVPAAIEYGMGDPVLGAGAAWKEVKGAIRNYYKYISHREQVPLKEIGIAQTIRSLGTPINAQPVFAADLDDSRKNALLMWDGPAAICGAVECRVGSIEKRQLLYAVIRAASEVLDELPELNKAILRGRIYQRVSSEVMLYSIYADNTWPIVIDGKGLPPERLARKLNRRYRAMIIASNHFLRPIGMQIYRAWIKEGMIASPAGLSISFVTGQGILRGHAALIPFNGVPISITVGDIVNEKVIVECVFDHRVFDGPHTGLFYTHFGGKVEQLCESWS